MTPDTARKRVLAIVLEQGFELAGIAPSTANAEALGTAKSALAGGNLADMGWMTSDWLERATDPDRFLPGATSLIVVALPNHSEEPEIPADGQARGRVARYARGRDYHRVFEGKLRKIAKQLREEFGVDARPTVDYGPLLERPYAEMAGLAWRGKSTMALVPAFGPWVMLGVVATTLELAPDVPLKKTCGSCTRCIVACPTQAIAPDGHVLDARKCISYHTIENRGVIPRELRSKFGDWVFGCDACLDACPVGATQFSSHPDFVPPSVDHGYPKLRELLTLDDETFAERFRGRAIMRAKRDGLVRNACIALGNVGDSDDIAALAGALGDAAAVVRGHAAWALGALADRHDSALGPAKQTLENALAVEHDTYVREEISMALNDLPE